MPILDDLFGGIKNAVGGLNTAFSPNADGSFLGMDKNTAGMLGMALMNAGNNGEGGGMLSNLMMMKMLGGDGNDIFGMSGNKQSNQPNPFDTSKPAYNASIPPLNAAAMNRQMHQPPSMIPMSKDYGQFDPKLQAALPLIMNDLTAKGWQPTVASGIRTPAEQAEKVKLGYSQTMNSKHLVGKAADIVDKRYGWDGPAADQNFQFWKDLGESAKRHGAQWGGTWKSFPDVAHVQVSLLDQLKNQMMQNNSYI